MRPQVIILATVFLNAVLFVANFVVALPSGSRAVLSQAIYCATDLTGALLLLWGAYASQRPPSYDHPFGHGKERFFWAFVASLVTFSAAGLLALTTGLDQVSHPGPIQDLGEGLIVLGLSIVGSLVGVLITLRELRLARETVDDLLGSAHLGIKTIFYQDLVSIAGAGAAFAGVLTVDLTHWYPADGISAAVVGVLLISAGFLLTSESRELLIGKSIPLSLARAVLAQVERDPAVLRVRELQSMRLGPDDALVALRVNFPDRLTTDEIEAAVDRIATDLKASFPGLRHIVIEPES